MVDRLMRVLTQPGKLDMKKFVVQNAGKMVAGSGAALVMGLAGTWVSKRLLVPHTHHVMDKYPCLTPILRRSFVEMYECLESNGYIPPHFLEIIQLSHELCLMHTGFYLKISSPPNLGAYATRSKDRLDELLVKTACDHEHKIRLPYVRQTYLEKIPDVQEDLNGIYKEITKNLMNPSRDKDSTPNYN